MGSTSSLSPTQHHAQFGSTSFTRNGYIRECFFYLLDWFWRGDIERAASRWQDLIFPKRLRARLLHFPSQRCIGAVLYCLELVVSCHCCDSMLFVVDKSFGHVHGCHGTKGTKDISCVSCLFILRVHCVDDSGRVEWLCLKKKKNEIIPLKILAK